MQKLFEFHWLQSKEQKGERDGDRKAVVVNQPGIGFDRVSSQPRRS